jgi:hypothetical protein
MALCLKPKIQNCKDTFDGAIYVGDEWV